MSLSKATFLPLIHSNRQSRDQHLHFTDEAAQRVAENMGRRPRMGRALKFYFKQATESYYRLMSKDRSAEGRLLLTVEGRLNRRRKEKRGAERPAKMLLPILGVRHCDHGEQ